MLRFFILLSALRTLYLVGAQEPPATNCVEHFAYVKEGDDYFGAIKLAKLQEGSTTINVSFTQRALLDNRESQGSIAPYPNKQAQKIDQPVLYRVQFPNPRQPPKLTLLAINGNALCTDTNYPPPSSWFSLRYTVELYVNSNNRNWHSVQPTPATIAPTVPSMDPAIAANAQQQNMSNLCGHEGTIIRPLLYGGTELMRGQFPWMSAIYRKGEARSISYLCGGSLISTRTIISAAHCFQRLSASQVVIFMGRYNLESYSEEGVVISDVEKLVRHPDYKLMPDADLALLQVATTISFTDFVRPICLWSASSALSGVVDQTATVAGWGSNKQGQLVSPRPKRTDVTVVSEAECLRSSPVFSQLLTTRTFCAGNRDGNGPCMGDSGSGLALQRNNRWLLRGIVSFGQTKRGQCDLREYVIYADVAQFLPWLLENVL